MAKAKKPVRKPLLKDKERTARKKKRKRKPPAPRVKVAVGRSGRATPLGIAGLMGGTRRSTKKHAPSRNGSGKSKKRKTAA